MAKGIDLGTGWINVVPSFKGMGKAVADSLGDASGIGAKAGGQIGQGLGAGITARLSSVTSSIGSAFAGAFDVVAKSAAAAGAAAATGLAAAVKGSISAYGEYEQLVGGVETLFKDNAGTVQKYASQAYKTAGMSANQYMETITGFSASLLQGLGGDTAKAAEIGNRAVIDMSDNANKMGTDMGRITDAYQGFAKQNYTMLDNLKLGYGGTKEEMARLISDASKLTDVQAQLGVTVDESSMSFDNIVNAISVVQKNMDITGTTALEAAGTLQGSMAMMKASWTDLLTAFGSGENVDAAMGNFLASLETYLGNLVPVARRAAGNIVEALRSELEARFPVLAGPFDQFEGILGRVVETFKGPGASSMLAGLAPVFGGVAAAIAGPLLSGLPMVGTAFAGLTGPVGIVIGLFAGLLAKSDGLREGLGRVAEWVGAAFGKAFETLGPVLEQVASQMGRVAGLIGDTLGQALERLAPLVGNLIVGFAQMAADLLPLLLPVLAQVANMFEAIVPVLTSLAAALLPAIAQVVGAVVTSVLPPLMDIIGAILPIVTDLVTMLLPVVIDIVNQLAPLFSQVAEVIGHVVEALVPIVEKVGELISAVLPPLLSLVGELVPIIVGVVSTIIDSFLPVLDSIIAALTAVVDFVVGVFTGDWDRAWQAVKDLFSSAWDALVGALGAAWDTIKALVSAGWETVKALFSTALDFVKQIFGGAWDWVVGVAQGVWDRIVGALGALAGLGAKAGEWFGRFKDGAVEKFGEAVEWVKGIPGRILDALGDIGSTLWNAGSDIINGFIDGIRSAFGGVQEALGGLTDLLPDWKGPAAVDRVILRGPARLIMGGFADELEDYGYGATRKALGSLTDALPSMVGSARVTIPVDGTSSASLPSSAPFGGGQVVNFHIGAINNPVAEPSSTTLNRELQRVGAGTTGF